MRRRRRQDGFEVLLVLARLSAFLAGHGVLWPTTPTATTTTAPSAAAPTVGRQFIAGLCAVAKVGFLVCVGFACLCFAVHRTGADARQALTGQNRQATIRRLWGRRYDPLLALLVAPAATATAARRALCLLLRHFGHRQIAFGGHTPAAAARVPVDTRDLGDIDELVGDLDQVRAGVAAEADHLDAHTLLLHGADGRREVAIARHDDGDVQVARGAHEIDGEEALARLAEGTIDVVVTDIKLPGLSGFDLVASMQQNFPDIPVIAISGYSDIDTAINVLKHGAADFIAKPFELAALQESTRVALEKTRVYREIRHLRHGLNNGAEFGGMLSKTREMDRLFEIIRMVAPTEMTVAIEGETGTGKELVASAVHYHSNRGKKPFVTINCAGFPKRFWRASFSVMRRALLPARTKRRQER